MIDGWAMIGMIAHKVAYRNRSGEMINAKPQRGKGAKG